MNLTNSQYEELMYHYYEQQARSHAEMNERREEVYHALPEMEALDAKVRSLSLAYVRASSNRSGKDDSESFHKEMDQLRLQKSRLLLTHGWKEDYLDPIYECPDCHDTGYINGEKCHCLKKRTIDYLYRQSNLSNILETENFDHFDLSLYDTESVDEVTGLTPREAMTQILKDAKRFVDDFDSDITNLLLYGDTGVGKTFLSHCIAKELLDSSHTVLYLAAIDFFEFLESRQFDPAMRYEEKDAMLSYILDCDLLILDDLGTELTNGFTNTQLYHVIEARLLQNRATIISTNLSIGELNDLYTERVFSRIMSNYQCMKLIGDDIRFKKNL